MPPSTTRDAPRNLSGILKELGPGLIIAGSIVGSGELIATTLTGAAAGFWLMWLIIIGCVIKVFTQLEIGRYTVMTGRTSLEGLAKLPGFKLGGVHWVIWFWLLMFFATLGQTGGIVGAIGQAVGMTQPITEEGQVFNEIADAQVKSKFDFLSSMGASESADGSGQGDTGLESVELPPEPIDVKIYAFAISLATALLLFRGGYGFIEKAVMVLVGSFTLLSIYNVVMLQMNAEWAISWAELRQGFSFRFPPVEVGGADPMLVALATFGIIGMAAGELVYYPYWCLEKGYSRFVGPRDESPEWNRRAQGWMRVMKWDAWLSMVVYTLSTVVFYMLGAAVLNRADIMPGNADLVRTLAAIFEPVFGETSVVLFLIGAVAVLYSTFLVGSASSALVFSDAIKIFHRARKWSFPTDNLKRYLFLAIPLIAFFAYLGFSSPVALILLAGFMNTLMLPILAFAALYYRNKYTHEVFKPSLLWDCGLWVSALGLLGFGIWALWGRVSEVIERF